MKWELLLITFTSLIIASLAQIDFSTPSDEELEVLLAAEARRVAGEEIVIVGNGTVNLDPREFLLRQFPHLARRIFGSAFGNLTNLSSSTESSSTTSTTERLSSSTSTTTTTRSMSTGSPQITTTKPELKLSQLIPNEEKKEVIKEEKGSSEVSGSKDSSKFSMIIPDLSHKGEKGPRPSRISLLPFGSAFLAEFSSNEEARKHVVKAPKLESSADNPYDSKNSKNFAPPVEKSPKSSTIKGNNRDDGSSASASILDTVTKFPPAVVASSTSNRFFDATVRPYELKNNVNRHQTSPRTTTTTTVRPSPTATAFLTLESTAAPFPSSTTASSRSFDQQQSSSSTPASLMTDDAIDGAPCNVTELTFDALKDGLELGDYLMIDVRPKEETDITGLIPGSINIPGPNLRDELDLPEIAFEHKHQYLKPDPKQGPRLVLTGRNETDVVNVVRQLQASGFDHLWIYPRGILDWILHGALTVNSKLVEDDEVDRMDEVEEDEEEDAPVAESNRRNIYRAIGVDRFDEKDIDYITYEQLKSMMNQNQQLILIDVRRREVFRRGSVPGAFNLPLHLITFDVPMQPGRFNQKYGFTLPSKLALGNVVVFGRDRYDGVGAVKRFRVVGYKVCQVYVGYDDWKKNLKEEEAKAASVRETTSPGSVGVASDVNFVTRPPPNVASSTYTASPYPTTTPDPRLLFRSSAADNTGASVPATLTEADIQIIVVGQDVYKIHKAVANLKETGYNFVTAHVMQSPQKQGQRTWTPLKSNDLKACFLPGNNYIPQGAGSGQQPTVVKASRDIAGGKAANQLTTYRRTPTLKSPQHVEKPFGKNPPTRTLNFQRPHEETSAEQQVQAPEDESTSPGEDPEVTNSEEPGVKSNKLKVVKEEVFFKDLLQKIQKGDYKVFEFRSDESVRRDGKIPRSAVLKLWDIPGVVTMQESEFQSKFGFKKPSLDGSDVVVNCDDPQTGREAVRRFRQLGYTRAALLSGCFAQWKSLGGPVQHPMPSRIGTSELALQIRKGAVIIDVGDLKLEGREQFPKSVNIPVSDLRPAFHMSDREFQQKFGFQKSDKNAGAPMILVAANPQMVHDASKVLASLGYHNVRLLYMDR